MRLMLLVPNILLNPNIYAGKYLTFAGACELL
jgi:hypothetical protein